MNLTKLFNFNYFKENLKKSKGLLAFFFGLVPLLNILFLILNLTNNKGSLATLLDFNDLSIITYLGLFLIPISLAILLFGFLFKRKSVDFILSKPLNRKNIYITNYLGGLGIILLFTILNCLIFFFFNFTSLVIPFNLIIDYFLYWLISYIFVFTISTFAISLAGNIMGTIVIVMLAIFLFPFLNLSNTFLSGWNLNTYIKCSDASCKPLNFDCHDNKLCLKKAQESMYPLSYHEIPKANYTAPLMILNNETLTFNTSSIIKMLLLSVIYALTSFYIFLHRKMENNETSFKNETLHYIIKSLTLIPVCFLTYLIVREEKLGLLVSIVIIIIYSIIYDLITRKEIYRFLKSSLISLIILGFLLGSYTIYEKTTKNTVLDIKDIDYLVYGYQDKIKITDKKLINNLIKENNEPIKVSSSYVALEMYAHNKRYTLNITISDTNLQKLANLIKKEKANNAKNFDINHINYVRDLKLTSKIKKLIIDTYNKGNYTIEEADSLLTIYTYRHHKYEMIYIPKRVNKDLDKYVLQQENTKAINLLNNNNQSHFYVSNNLSNLDMYIFDYVINRNITSFINYLETNNLEYSKDTLTINIYNDYNSLILEIGDLEKFKQEFNLYKEKLQEDPTLQELINEFNEE